jgi:hypothetical protein
VRPVARIAWALPVVAALASCATTPRGGAPEVEVTTFEVRLDGPDDGELRVELALPPPRDPFEEVEWALELSGLRVAAGFDRAQSASPRPDGRVALLVTSPLVFKGVPWVGGSSFARVRVSGVVRVQSRPPVELAFSAQREVLVKGTPALGSERE